MRAGLYIDAVLQKNIGSAQHIFTCVEREGDVVQTSLGSGMVARVGEIVTLVRRGHPHAGLRAIVEYDLFGQHEAEIVLKKLAIGFDVGSQAIEMVDPTHINATRRKLLGLVFERGF